MLHWVSWQSVLLCTLAHCPVWPRAGIHGPQGLMLLPMTVCLLTSSLALQGTRSGLISYVCVLAFLVMMMNEVVVGYYGAHMNQATAGMYMAFVIPVL